jgi:hypothetical protein
MIWGSFSEMFSLASRTRWNRHRFRVTLSQVWSAWGARQCQDFQLGSAISVSVTAGTDTHTQESTHWAWFECAIPQSLCLGSCVSPNRTYLRICGTPVVCGFKLDVSTQVSRVARGLFRMLVMTAEVLGLRFLCLLGEMRCVGLYKGLVGKLWPLFAWKT